MANPVSVGDVLLMMELEGTTWSLPAKRAFADYLRANQTSGERMMARVLYHLGIEAEPQVLLKGWIVDFLDRANRIVFEVDGPIHEGRQAQDGLRDEVMTAAGYRVIRISNEGVANLMANVVAARSEQ